MCRFRATAEEMRQAAAADLEAAPGSRPTSNMKSNLVDNAQPISFTGAPTFDSHVWCVSSARDSLSTTRGSGGTRAIFYRLSSNAPILIIVFSVVPTHPVAGFILRFHLPVHNGFVLGGLIAVCFTGASALYTYKFSNWISWHRTLNYLVNALFLIVYNRNADCYVYKYFYKKNKRIIGIVASWLGLFRWTWLFILYHTILANSF